jgi:hypothetical protein
MLLEHRDTLDHPEHCDHAGGVGGHELEPAKRIVPPTTKCRSGSLSRFVPAFAPNETPRSAPSPVSPFRRLLVLVIAPVLGAIHRGIIPLFRNPAERNVRNGVTTSLSTPAPGRSARRPEADTLHRRVRSRFTSPERDSFKPAPLRASSNSLNYRASNIRTKIAVVRLRQRKGPKRGRKWPKTGFEGRPRGSDKRPEKPTFCGFPTADQERKRMSRLRTLAEGEELPSNPLRAFFNELRTTHTVVDVDWRILPLLLVDCKAFLVPAPGSAAMAPGEMKSVSVLS